ncbi:MAG: DNA-binding protein [Promethearchaeota archaeon]
MSSENDEIQKIRQKKMEQLKRQAMEQQQKQIEEQQRQIYEQQKRIIMQYILDSDARLRLGNIRLARPQFAESIELELIQLYQQGILQRKFKLPLSDEQFKGILQKIQKEKRSTKIRIL